jgi:heat shock protein 5
MEDIESMIEEAEDYATEDEVNRARFESRVKLEEYTYSLKRQSKDIKGFVGKIKGHDKKFLVEVVKKTEDWLDKNAAKATVEDIHEQFQKLSDEVFEVTHRARWHWYCWWC